MSYNKIVPELKLKIKQLEGSTPTAINRIELGNAYKKLDGLVAKGYAFEYGMESPESPEHRQKMLKAYRKAMDMDPAVALDTERAVGESHMIILTEGLTGEEKAALAECRKGGMTETPMPSRIPLAAEEFEYE